MSKDTVVSVASKLKPFTGKEDINVFLTRFGISLCAEEVFPPEEPSQPTDTTLAKYRSELRKYELKKVTKLSLLLDGPAFDVFHNMPKARRAW